MVVGSFNSWLQTRPSFVGAHDLPNKASTTELPNWSLQNDGDGKASSAAAAPVPRVALAPTAVKSINTPVTVHSASPQQSLLTVQIRHHELAASDGDAKAEVGSRQNHLERASSVPRLREGTACVALDRDALSSPLDFNTLQGCVKQPRGAALMQKLTSGQVLERGEPTHQGVVVDVSSEAWPSLMINTPNGASESGTTSSSDCTCVSTPRLSLEPHYGAVETRTSQKRNVYDGTVRGGQPRKSLEGQRAAQIPRWGRPVPSAHLKPVSVVPTRPYGQPRCLADMLQSALQRV